MKLKRGICQFFVIFCQIFVHCVEKKKKMARARLILVTDVFTFLNLLTELKRYFGTFCH